MSKEQIQQFTIDVIQGFEIGLYQTVQNSTSDRIKCLSKRENPFIGIIKSLHEIYYNTTYNSFLAQLEDSSMTPSVITDIYLHLETHHIRCILTVLANLVVSVHYNLTRENLDTTTMASFTKTLREEIISTISFVDLEKLFDHPCDISKDNELRYLSEGENIITIQITSEKDETKN